jgi:hypothetical protein
VPAVTRGLLAPHPLREVKAAASWQRKNVNSYLVLALQEWAKHQHRRFTVVPPLPAPPPLPSPLPLRGAQPWRRRSFMLPLWRP